MEKLVQFSVFLVNSPGMLSQIYRELAKAKVNITGIAMMDSTEHGVLRMLTADTEAAREVFKRLDVSVAETSVLSVTLPNRPGAVAELCDRLSDAHIKIGYMYCTTGTRGGKSTAILRVPDIAKAVRVLNRSRNTRRDMKVKLRRPAATTRR